MARGDQQDWPAPVGESVVLLLEPTTPTERDIIDRWVASARPASSHDVDIVVLPSSDLAVAGALRPSLDADGDPWLAPVRLVWLPPQREGDRSVRVRDVVRSFGDPRHPRPARQRRIVRDEPDRCRLVVAEPARLSDLRTRWATVGRGDDSPAAFAQFVARQATLALERAESKVVGARYKVPRLVREEILASVRFRAGLERLAAELGRDGDEVTLEASRYLEEMVTGWTRLLIDLGVRLGKYNFRRGYDPDLDFDPAQVMRLREVAERYPLVFAPSHKSNLDTLVMNVALHENGLPRTHVFGGINMAFWPIAPIFRRAGTIFIRRDTRGKPVYTYTLREYVGYLLEKRFSFQFYVEGGRSRTGKLLPPKLGLLAYVADAYRDGRSEDVVLVPVSIAYDQLQEVSEFAREGRGAAKSAESITWLIRAFREQRGRFGKIYVRFGEPLSLRDALGPPGPPPLDADGEVDRLPMQKVALEVSRRINEVTPITATSLVTLSLLGAQGRALTLEQVAATVHDPLDYARRRGLPLATRTTLDSTDGVRRVLQELERHHVVTQFAEGPEPVFAIGPDQHLAAAFYRNSIIHFFLHGALVQAALARAAQSGVTDPVATFWESVLAQRDLLKFEFFFEPREEFRGAIARELSFHDPLWEERVAGGSDAIHELLRELHPLTAHTVLRSFLEAYSVVAAALERHDGAKFDRRQFLSACLALGRQYQMQQRIHSPESLSRPLFANALQLAESRSLVGPTADKAGQRRLLDEVRGVIRDLDLVELLSTTRVVELISTEPQRRG